MKVRATMRLAPAARRAAAQAVRVAPVVRTSSTRRTLRGASAIGLDPRRVADPLGAAAADLMAGAAAREAGDRPAPSLARQGRGQLTGRVEAPAPQTRRRGRDRDHRPAQQVRGREPVHPLGHHLRHRQQAPELQRADQRPGDAVVRGRGPDAVDPCGPPERIGRAAAERPRAARAEHRLRPTSPPAGRAERRRDERGGDTERSPCPDPGRQKRTRGAQKVKSLCQAAWPSRPHRPRGRPRPSYGACRGWRR